MNSNPNVFTCGKIVLANRILNVLSIGVPLLGAIAAIGSLSFLPPTMHTVLVFVPYFVVCAWSISAGLHRYFSHHSFKTNAWLEYCLAFFGTTVCQGPIVRWVADHRRHHSHTDRAWDPHSPYFHESRAISNRWVGLMHAHLGWMLIGHVSSEVRFAPEYIKGTAVRFASDWYYSICAIGFLLPAGLGYVIGGPEEGLRCLLWAGFFRVALLHQLTWSVNSIGHMFGQRPVDGIGQSVDNAVLTYLVLGEGLHGTHHVKPTKGVLGNWHSDLTGSSLRVLQKFGLIWDLRR